jgi:hypothetical protein
MNIAMADFQATPRAIVQNHTLLMISKNLVPATRSVARLAVSRDLILEVDHLPSDDCCTDKEDRYFSAYGEAGSWYMAASKPSKTSHPSEFSVPAVSPTSCIENSEIESS